MLRVAGQFALPTTRPFSDQLFIEAGDIGLNSEDMI